jgi:hypothetical protein
MLQRKSIQKNQEENRNLPVLPENQECEQQQPNLG